jgi:hypothetical protein
MDFGRVCIILGAVLLVVGAIFSVLPKGFEPFAWFGRLTGDISYKSDSVTVWIPITSMVVVSVVLSLGVKLINWLSRWWWVD